MKHSMLSSLHFDVAIDTSILQKYIAMKLMLEGFDLIYANILLTNSFICNRAIHTFLNESGLTRQHIYVTTKLWPNNRNKAESKQALYDSLQRLNLDYIDLYLIHSPNDVDKRIEQWQALEGTDVNIYIQYGICMICDIILFV